MLKIEKQEMTQLCMHLIWWTNEKSSQIDNLNRFIKSLN